MVIPADLRPIGQIGRQTAPLLRRFIAVASICIRRAKTLSFGAVCPQSQAGGYTDEKLPIPTQIDSQGPILGPDDARDSKSRGRKVVWVRVPPPAVSDRWRHQPSVRDTTRHNATRSPTSRELPPSRRGAQPAPSASPYANQRHSATQSVSKRPKSVRQFVRAFRRTATPDRVCQGCRAVASPRGSWRRRAFGWSRLGRGATASTAMGGCVGGHAGSLV